MVRRSKEESEATKKLIVDTANRLFLSQGYAATSTRQIADEAGVTMGALYNHFKSKEDLWKEVFNTRHPYYDIYQLVLKAEGETVEEFIRNAAHLMVAELGQRKDLLNLMFIEIVEFKGQDISGLVVKVIPDVLKFMARTGKLKGKVRKVPVPILTRAFLGLFFSYYITEILIGDQLKPMMGSHPLDDMVDLYLYGLMEEPTLKGEPK